MAKKFLGTSPSTDEHISTKGYTDDRADVAVVNHGSTAGTARPSGYSVVFWIGSADPTNKQTGDIWIDTNGG